MARTDRKSVKVCFSHDIDPEVAQIFQEVAKDLPGDMYEVLEAMIRAFQALPDELRIRLMSAKPETRAPVLALLASLGEPPTSRKSARGSKSGGSQ